MCGQRNPRKEGLILTRSSRHNQKWQQECQEAGHVAPTARKKEWWLPQPQWLLLFIQCGAPAHGRAMPTSRLGHVSMVIVSSVDSED